MTPRRLAVLPSFDHLLGKVPGERRSERGETSLGGPFRSREIDSMRVLAACAIFYFHLSCVTSAPCPNWGNAVAQVFVTLAGYCLCRFSTLSNAGGLTLMARRLDAIYPIYLAVTILLYFGSHIYPSEEKGESFSPSDLVWNLSLLSQYVGRDYFTDSMWFVPYLLQVYLFVPTIARMTESRPLATLGGCAAVSAVACGLAFEFEGQAAPLICSTWSPLFVLPPLWFGVALGQARDRYSFIRAVAGYGVVAVAWKLIMISPFDEELEWRLLSIFFAMGFLVACTFGAVAAGIFGGSASLLGRASLAFFLLHGAGMRWVSHLDVSNQIWVAVWAVYFVICWIASVCLTVWDQEVRYFFRRCRVKSSP